MAVGVCTQYNSITQLSCFTVVTLHLLAFTLHWLSNRCLNFDWMTFKTRIYCCLLLAWRAYATLIAVIYLFITMSDVRVCNLVLLSIPVTTAVVKERYGS